MTMENYISEIKLQLTGGVLQLEIDDASLVNLVNSCLTEVQRYIDITELITIPFANCIDLKDSRVSSVVRVYRAEGYLDNSAKSSAGYADPMYASQWQLLSGTGNMYNLNDWVLNYASYNTLLQLRNSTSTDMAFKYDKSMNKLYVNSGADRPDKITVEYVPLYKDVSEITSDYWIDILTRLSIAKTKQVLGRIRTRYTQSIALWAGDGETMLAEGNAELDAIREHLRVASQLVYPID